MSKRLRLLFLLGMLTGCSADALVQNNLGNLAYRSGSYSEAAALYQSSLIADPHQAAVYFNLALSYEAQGNIDRAAAAYKQAALRGEPLQQSDAYFNLGNLYFRNQQLALSVDAFRNAIRANPNNNDARYNLELALALIGQPTPTPIEMQTSPNQGNVNPTSPPTPIPGAGLPPTPTPTPEIPGLGTPDIGGSSTDSVSDSRVPPNPLEEGKLDVEAARRFALELQFQQNNIGLPRPAAPIATPGSLRDW